MKYGVTVPHIPTIIAINSTHRTSEPHADEPELDDVLDRERAVGERAVERVGEDAERRRRLST